MWMLALCVLVMALVYDRVNKLIELIQAQVASRGIPVFSSRIGLPVRIDHIPLPDETVKNLG